MTLTIINNGVVNIVKTTIRPTAALVAFDNPYQNGVYNRLVICYVQLSPGAGGSSDVSANIGPTSALGTSQGHVFSTLANNFVKTQLIIMVPPNYYYGAYEAVIGTGAVTLLAVTEIELL